MGRFDPTYLAAQEIIVARQAGRVVGFASFHAAYIGARTVWTLDLLRPDPDAPDGTSQSLVMAALEAARERGVKRLSLAAVPVGAGPSECGFIAWAGRNVMPASALGLARFKAGFAPHWQRLYIAGPSLPALAVVALEIWREVRHPPPLANLNPTTRCDEEYEIATGRIPWHRKKDKPA